MSATTFAGSAQFAASILEDGGGAVAAIVAALLLKKRYVPLSLGVASIFPGSRRRRLLEAQQLIVDESWALSGRSGRFEYGILVGVGILLYVVWVGGTALGTVIGDLLDPEAIGIDAAFPALFLALLAPYLRDPARARDHPRGRHDHACAPAVHTPRRADRRREPRLPDRASQMIWIVIAVVGAVTILFKASGPVLLGDRELPPRALALVEVLAPAMLAALVVTQTVGGNGELVFDERLAGVAAGGIAIWLRAPLLVVMVVAAATAALIRLSNADGSKRIATERALGTRPLLPSPEPCGSRRLWRGIWPGTHPQIEVLGGGITNRNFKITLDDGAYVLGIRWQGHGAARHRSPASSTRRRWQRPVSVWARRWSRSLSRRGTS